MSACDLVVFCMVLTYLECRNLAVQEDTREIELDLETDCRKFSVSNSERSTMRFAKFLTVNVGTIDRRRPPQGEATVAIDC